VSRSWLGDRGRIDVLNRASALASADSGRRAILDIGAAHYRAVAVRVAVVLAALLIFYLRMPTTFTNPQFWGEDIDLFYGARVDGWSALSTVMAGYLVCAQFLVAILANYFSPIAAPAIYNYAAIVLTLLVVWLVTSPRLQMPATPLLALAVVVVPMGYEELGTITNIQWILPIGAFALLFMDAPRQRVVVLGEAILVALTSFSGPFAIFLTPLYAWKLAVARGAVERSRFAVLTAIVIAGALTQLVVISRHPEAVNPIPAVPYSPTLWITLTWSRILTAFGPVSRLFTGLHGTALGLLLFVGVAIFAMRAPFRTQKIFMVLFATAIALGGMYKFRASLGALTYATRYFYAGSVFSLWFLCCLSSEKYVRFGLVALVGATELLLVPVVTQTPRITTDLQWRTWATHIESGLPVIIPTAPRGWYLNLPATPAGPLAQFASWLGRDINQMAKTDPSACSGSMGLVLPLDMFHLEPVHNIGPRELWTTRGVAWDAQRAAPAPLVALIDQTDKVIGFGLPGFSPRPDTDTGALQTEWIGNFLAAPGLVVHAHAIVGDGQRTCRFGAARRLPKSVVSLPSDGFVVTLPVTPDKEITQSFRRIGKLSGILAQFVARARDPTPYTIRWRIVGSLGTRELELGSGDIQTGEIYEWQPVELPISAVSDEAPQQMQVSFKALAKTPISVPVGIALSRPDSTAPAARIGDEPAPTGAQLGLTLLYAD
jgi:hypothetical protein